MLWYYRIAALRGDKEVSHGRDICSKFFLDDMRLDFPRVGKKEYPPPSENNPPPPGGGGFLGFWVVVGLASYRWQNYRSEPVLKQTCKLA